MTASRPGAVFDCMVFVQALASRKGPAFACKQLVDSDQVTLFLSPPVVAELTEVLNRPKIQRKLAGLTPERAEAFLRDLTGKAVLLDEVPEVFRYPRDPKDEPYVNLALAARADYLVTRDKDLLDLMDGGLPTGKDFRERFPGLSILDPVAFLDKVSPKPEVGQPPEPTAG